MRNPEKAPSRFTAHRATLLVTALAVLIVLLPYFFWRSTWFGRQLTDEQITAYLAEQEKPRKAQHALAQISERLARGDPAVAQWYPQVLSLAAHPLPELRLTAAWVMGQDNQREEFGRELRQMLHDPEPLVRRNAALSLVRFEDDAGHGELLAMLRPYTVVAPQSGTLANRLEQGDVVDHGTLLARLTQEGQEEPVEIRSPLPGVVRERLLEDGAAVAAGDPVTVLDPDAEHAYQALRGLYLMGRLEDLEDVRRFLRPRDHLNDRVLQQARLTAERIRQRAGEGPIRSTADQHE